MAFHIGGMISALIGIAMMVLGTWERRYPRAVPAALLALVLLASAIMATGLYIDNLNG